MTKLRALVKNIGAKTKISETKTGSKINETDKRVAMLTKEREVFNIWNLWWK